MFFPQFWNLSPHTPADPDPRDDGAFASKDAQIEALKEKVSRLESLVRPLAKAVEAESRLQPRLLSKTDWPALAKELREAMKGLRDNGKKEGA
jgi:hypothetical protein